MTYTLSVPNYKLTFKKRLVPKYKAPMHITMYIYYFFQT